MTEKIADATVYIIFLKGQRDHPDNKYVGVTTKSLSKRFKEHKNSYNCKSYKRHNKKLYKIMREKGIDNWAIMPLAELWLSTKVECFKLEKYYIRLLKPDLNPRNGSLSNEECERMLNWSAQPWTCPTCLKVSQAGSKWNTTGHRLNGFLTTFCLKTYKTYRAIITPIITVLPSR